MGVLEYFFLRRDSYKTHFLASVFFWLNTLRGASNAAAAELSRLSTLVTGAVSKKDVKRLGFFNYEIDDHSLRAGSPLSRVS